MAMAPTMTPTMAPTCSTQNLLFNNTYEIKLIHRLQIHITNQIFKYLQRRMTCL